MDEDIEGTVKLSSEENDIKRKSFGLAISRPHTVLMLVGPDGTERIAVCPTCHLSYFEPGYIAFCPHSHVVRYLLHRIVEEDDNRTFGEVRTLSIAHGLPSSYTVSLLALTSSHFRFSMV